MRKAENKLVDDSVNSNRSTHELHGGILRIVEYEMISVK
jgi:hypothetical protein